MRKTFYLLIIVITIGIVFFNVTHVLAYDFSDIGKFYTTTGQSAGFNTAAGRFALISSIINAIIGLAGSIFIALIIYGGFLWMTSRGAEDKIKKGKEVITYSVIGIVIIAGAYAITSLIAGAAFSGGSTPTDTGGTTPQTCQSQGGVCLTAYQCSQRNGTYLGAPNSPIPLDCNTEVCCIGAEPPATTP